MHHLSMNSGLHKELHLNHELYRIVNRDRFFNLCEWSSLLIVLLKCSKACVVANILYCHARLVTWCGDSNPHRPTLALRHRNSQHTAAAARSTAMQSQAVARLQAALKIPMRWSVCFMLLNIFWLISLWPRTTALSKWERAPRGSCGMCAPCPCSPRPCRQPLFYLLAHCTGI